jgi:hypothetical protein
MTKNEEQETSSPISVRVFKPYRSIKATQGADSPRTEVQYVEISDPPHLTADPDIYVKEYIKLRKERYLVDKVPYNDDAQRFLDEHLGTRLVLAFKNEKLLGGGRLVRKAPEDDSNLSFGKASFNKNVVNLLKEAGLTLEDVNVIEVGGVVANKDSGVTTFITPSVKIQRKLAELRGEYPNITVSTVAAKNLNSAARTVKDDPTTHAIIYPEEEMGGAKVNLCIFTNIDAVAKAMQKMIGRGEGMSPAQAIYQKRVEKKQSQTEKRTSQDPSNDEIGRGGRSNS